MSDAEQISVLIAECQRMKDLLVNGVTLSDAEREAIEWSVRSCEREEKYASDAADRNYAPDCRAWAARHGDRARALRGLLERLK